MKFLCADVLTDADARELDKFIAEKVYGYKTEYRYITGDPECDGTYEIQHLYEFPVKRAKEDRDAGLLTAAGKTTTELTFKNLLKLYKDDWEDCKTKEKDLCIKKEHGWEICPHWATNVSDSFQLYEWLFSQKDIFEISHSMINPYFRNADGTVEKNDMPHTVSLLGPDSNAPLSKSGWNFPNALSGVVVNYCKYKKHKSNRIGKLNNG